MLKEAFEFFKALVAPTEVAAAPGFTLSDRPLHSYDKREAQPAVIDVTTLSALADLVAAQVNDFPVNDAIIHVVDHATVTLKARVSDKYGRRSFHVNALLPKLTGFKFGEFHSHEEFLIGVMAQFTADGDREYLLRIASNLTDESVIESSDNGITQTVGLKKGAALKTTEVLRQRVQLSPFRTFREATQPTSEFIFRVRQEEGAIPKLALFEADGGKWRIDAVLAVRDWIKEKTKGIPVVA